MSETEEQRIRSIGNVLLDTKKPLKDRFRALFSLRNVPGPLSIFYISKGFSDSSALLKHELAYCLGQMQDETAVPILCQVLENVNQEPIVRHEAAEALGAIESNAGREYLGRYSHDPVRVVSETCRLALDRLAWLQNEGWSAGYSANPYKTIDPTPASTETDVSRLESILLDRSLPLFRRYMAMFALRNLGTDDSAMVLTKGLKTESALFSHEVAFVLGQMQKEVSVPALADCLSDTTQNEMVRHECAEALGAIATDECFNILKNFLDDDKQVVRESCEVALDMCEYEVANEFQYALT